MKIFFLSADNLKSGPFIKDLVYNFKDVGKSIILHDHFGNVNDTRFVTKRISALLSEEMILNNAFSGDQRGILTQTAAQITIRKELLDQAHQTIDAILLNPLGLIDGQLGLMDAKSVIAALRSQYAIESIHLFPKNSRSPLVAQARHLRQAQEIADLLMAYEEEASILSLAQNLLPVLLAAPGNFKHEAAAQ
jgi:hypothetical protein